jgi:20S proteasome subunit beta 3
MATIETYNGSALLAMGGDGCVAIASDRRFGVQMQTVTTTCQRIFQINDRIFLGLAGLLTDVQTVYEHLRYEVNLLELREERVLEPPEFVALVHSLLYKHRFGPFFVQPVIAGLNSADGSPVVQLSDSIGAFARRNDFVVAGTSSEAMFGNCESLWRPGLNPDELFQVISKCLIAGCGRDGLAGWGGVVHILTPDSVVTRTIKTRMD